jgi:hypothetical protein
MDARGPKAAMFLRWHLPSGPDELDEPPEVRIVAVALPSVDEPADGLKIALLEVPPGADRAALLPLLRRLAKELKSGPLIRVPSGQGTNGTADLMRLDSSARSSRAPRSTATTRT